jgi:hypothetical protein
MHTNDIGTDRDYDEGLQNVPTQRAHAVHATTSLTFRGERWHCSTSDGYMCHCKRQRAGKDVLAAARAAAGAATWPSIAAAARAAAGAAAWPAGAVAGAPSPVSSTGALEGEGLFGRRRLRRQRGRDRAGDRAGGAFDSSSSSSSSGGGSSSSSSSSSGGAVSSAPDPPCPTGGDLEDPAQLDAMLAARASPNRDVVITILGPTTGTRAIQMSESIGEAFVLNLLTTLRSFGVTNTLPITTHLHVPEHPGNNLCLSRLRPRGVCCAYSGVGMHLVHASGPGRAWTVDETHPYMLFLQRWWLTGQAVYRGYNVLSLDTDLHLAVNPLELLNGVAYAPAPPSDCL